MQLGITVHILGRNGIGGGDNGTHDKSGEQTETTNEENGGFDEDDDKILKDNNKLINSMKFDDIKLNTYDRVFNRSFTNPIGYNYIGKRFAHIL